MILLDTNVLFYAFDSGSPFSQWARETIADAVVGGGAAINAVSLAEICVGDADPSTAADRIRSWGVEILDVPAAAADVCAKAYLRVGSVACLNPIHRFPPCRFPTFSSARMPRSWGGISPLRTAAGSIPISLLFLSKCRNDVRCKAKQKT